MQRYRAVIFPLCFFALCLFFWWQTTLLPPDDIGQEGVGMALFPTFCIILIAALSLVLLVRDLVFPARGDGDAERLSRQGAIRFAAVSLLMLAYSLGYEWLGFYLATYLFAVGLLLVLGERRLLMTALFPAGIIVFVHLGFVKVLDVVLPRGELMYLMFGS